MSAPVKPTMVETAVSTTPVYALDLASSVQDQVLTNATSVTSMPITTMESAYATTTGLATTAHNTLKEFVIPAVTPALDQLTATVLHALAILTKTTKELASVYQTGMETTA